MNNDDNLCENLIELCSHSGGELEQIKDPRQRSCTEYREGIWGFKNKHSTQYPCPPLQTIAAWDLIFSPHHQRTCRLYMVVRPDADWTTVILNGTNLALFNILC